LFENRHLFHALDESNESSATHHGAEMVGYLGLPSLEYVQRSEVTKKVFDEQGQYSNSFGKCKPDTTLLLGGRKGAGGVVVPSLSLEESEKFLDGENKQTSSSLSDRCLDGYQRKEDKLLNCSRILG
jgi:hypothetical protein